MASHRPERLTARAFAHVAAAGILIAIAATPARAAASPVRLRGPCTDCRASLPAGSDPSPLLVVLHGDRESADAMFNAWAPAVEARGWALFAPACPRSAGCQASSWWDWNHDLSWLIDQIHALGARRPLDPSRFWIVGWSGGASYIGRRTQEFQAVFAALVVHGGGMPPDDPRCGSTQTPVYFLVGSANPLHALAVHLREHYVACADDVTWTLLDHADHDGERRALAAHQSEILDWLAMRTWVAPSAVPPVVAPPKAPVSDTSAPSSGAATTPHSAPVAPSACGCATVGRRTVSPRAGGPYLSLTIAAIFALATHRRSKRGEAGPNAADARRR